MDISRIIEWNRKAWNKPNEIDIKLEIDMLQEEFDEYKAAMLRWDMIEIMDWAIDMAYVLGWTLYKLGFTKEQVEKCYQEICDSNDSKLPYSKDRYGKVTKWENYFKPDLKGILS